MGWEKYVTGLAEVAAMPAEELALVVLQVLKETGSNGKHYHPQQLTNTNPWMGSANEDEREEFHLAVGEALAWLKAQGLLLEAVGQSAGWMVLSRKARDAKTPRDLEGVRAAASFPKELIHPKIAAKSWLAIARGDFAEAVFSSYRAVEIAVREASGVEPHIIGVDLMRRAFHPDTGVLRDERMQTAEREATAALFAGAIGSFKNPHSHRDVSVEAAEARELVLLASYLLRVVEGRRLWAVEQGRRPEQSS